jgi:hydroxymethylglutaryl-CoA lyase
MTDVVLCECFARDGLQHEPDFVPTPTKQALIARFAALGFQRIEATSYSNPKVVPQFGDASALLLALPRRAGVHYKATCANVRAVERALADLDAGFGVTEISLWSRRARRIPRRTCGSRAPTNGTTCARWRQPRGAGSG